MVQTGFLTLAIALVTLVLCFLSTKTNSELQTSKRLLIVILVSWVGYLALMGNLGFFNDNSLPPRVPLFLILPIFLSLFLWLRKAGSKLIIQSIPFYFPVAIQSFRVVVELLIHATYGQGLLPRIVTYEGVNFDILVGLTAPLATGLHYRGIIGDRVLLGWNFVSLTVLASTVSTFVIAFYFGDQLNIPKFPMVVGNLPFIFLPGIMVPFAVFMHIISIRLITFKMKKAAI